MKCRRCGAVIPDGALKCRACGEEIRIVPDYNPLDEVLAAQVKGAIDGSKAPLDDYEYRAGNSQKGRTSGNTRRTSADPGKRQMTPEQRRRQAERRRAMKKKKRLRAMIILGMVAVAALILGVVLYQFSYGARVNKGYKALQKKEYSQAEEYFQKAVKKKPKKADAYEGLTELYLAQNAPEKAETLLLNAVDKYSDSAEVYEACFSYYIAVSQQGEIPLLLDEARKDVAKKLSDYAAETPAFSLDDEEIFEDVQQLSLESDEETIYYTTDGSDPFYSDTRVKYEEPIQISEGENVIKAVSVNKKEIPSLTITKTYTVEFPIEDAPAVSPSTGQYDSPMEISIIVPDGYTAYYTMDESEPTDESEIYTGPISMPEGSTIFKAVLVNGKGRLSGVTTRNYELTAE
ncbi:MAG: FN3 associated domain-containing protein [Eubacteriales bacterium]|nr:FN3 associated domain-containing protein [Eubacteriales bacterium]